MRRFWNKVKKSEGCWEWQASTRAGYGVIKIEGKNLSAHRVSYEMHNGKIPDGMVICHACDNRLCVNPNHLFIGTQRDNVVDSFLKGRRVAPEGRRFIKGHSPANRKLNESKVHLIISLYRQGFSNSSIADILGVGIHLVRDVRAGVSYRSESSTFQELPSNYR